MLKTAFQNIGSILRCGMIALAGIAILLPAAHAQSLYSARVDFDQRAGDSRADAYRAALRVVLYRVSGSELSSNAELIDELFPDPSNYVVQFRPGEDNSLWVSFDGQAVEKNLRQSGQLVWGDDRPPTLVIMALDRGNGERELVGASDAQTDNALLAQSPELDAVLRSRVLDAAEMRGLPVVFPLLDAEDIATFTFADVWGGFEAPVLGAAERYDVDSVLIGKLRADDTRLDRWTYFFSGEQYSWTGEPETVLGLVADRLAEEYAIGGDEPLRPVSLSVSGVTSVEAYGALQVMLKEVPVIDELRLLGVDGDRIDYRISAYGGASRLARALRLKGLVEEERIDLDESAGIPRDPRFFETLNFYYIP